MHNFKQPYNPCADIRIQMLGSDGAAFAVSKTASDTLQADSVSAEYHAHVYLEDGRLEGTHLRRRGATPAGVRNRRGGNRPRGTDRSRPQGQQATDGGEKTLDALAPRARTPDASGACR